jgi:CheY-like chemotaxis protein
VSGPRVYEQLGDQRPPALFISAHNGPATRREVTSAGGHELLIKPFVVEDFLDAILRAVVRGSVP